MTGSDEQFAKKLTVLLDRAADEISPGIAYRLQQARARALDGEHATATEPQTAHALAGSIGGAARGMRGSAENDRPLWAQWRLWIGIAAITGAVFGWQQWHAYRQILTYEELDAQILSSDLPIDAYLDRGFDAWLKTPAAN
jgi:uncharacterized protein DUF3619